MAPPKSRRSLVAALVACHAINDFTSQVLPPLFPALRAAFALTYLQAGILQFASTVVAASAQVPVAYAADRFRRRRACIVLGFLVYVAALLLLARAASFAGLVAATAILGLGASAYHPQSTSLIAIAYQRNRGRASGIHGIGNGIGFAGSSAIGGTLVARLGWSAAAAALAIPALVGAAIARLALPEPDVAGGAGLRAGLSRRLLLLTLVAGLTLSSATGFAAFLPAYYVSRGSTIAAAGILSALFQAPALVAQPLGGHISDRLGRRNVLIASSVGVSGSLVLFELVRPFVAAQVAASVLAGLWASLAPPIVLVYASELAVGQRTGTAVALVWGLGIMISSLAPPLAGSVIDHAGFGAAHLALAASALIAALAAMALPGMGASGDGRDLAPGPSPRRGGAG